MEIEEAFRNLKGDLSIRPVYHQKEERIEAHIFISFLCYCLHVTMRQRLKALAGGLTPRELLKKFPAIVGRCRSPICGIKWNYDSESCYSNCI